MRTSARCNTLRTPVYPALVCNLDRIDAINACDTDPVPISASCGPGRIAAPLRWNAKPVATQGWTRGAGQATPNGQCSVLDDCFA